MHDKKVDVLGTKINDIKWVMKIRELTSIEKIEEILNYCPCCVARVSRTLWLMSDIQLKESLAKLEDQYANKINIDDIHKKS